MPYANPTLGGALIFGLVTECQMITAPAARKISAFFGQDGLLSQYGGSRGRTFLITGVLEDVDIDSLNADEGAILAYQGPSTNTFTDTRGNSWPNVVFDGQFVPDPMGPKPTDTGWCLAYKMVLRGLS